MHISGVGLNHSNTCNDPGTFSNLGRQIQTSRAWHNLEFPGIPLICDMGLAKFTGECQCQSRDSEPSLRMGPGTSQAEAKGLAFIRQLGTWLCARLKRGAPEPTNGKMKASQKPPLGHRPCSGLVVFFNPH